jgi:hypothetical protein
VENLRDDGSVRTDYYTEEQLKLLVSTAAGTRGAHPLNFNDWPEFIVLDANTGLRCKEMLFLEFSDIDWNAGVLHVGNKTQSGFRPKGRKERRIPLNVPAMYALRSMFQKKHAKSEYVFHQGDGLPWKSILGIVPIAVETVWVQTIRRSHPEAYFWGASRAEGCGHGCDPRFTRTSQRHVDGKVLRACGAEQSCFSGAASEQKRKFIRKVLRSRSCALSRSGEIGIRSRLKNFGKPRFNKLQDLPKSTQNIVQTHDRRGFFANCSVGKG